MLFESGGDDYYGVMRADVLRRVLPQGSHYHADRTVMAGVALYGPFYQVGEWLYLRRDHPERPQHAHPTVRAWCNNMDPRRGSRLRHPAVRLLVEYVWAYVPAIRGAPLAPRERTECFAYLAQWVAGGAVRASRRALPAHGQPVAATTPGASGFTHIPMTVGPGCGQS
jgi:hypothetical protein